MEKKPKKLVKPMNELDTKLYEKYEALSVAECECRSDDTKACRGRKGFGDDDVDDILF